MGALLSMFSVDNLSANMNNMGEDDTAPHPLEGDVPSMPDAFVPANPLDLTSNPSTPLQEQVIEVASTFQSSTRDTRGEALDTATYYQHVNTVSDVLGTGSLNVRKYETNIDHGPAHGAHEQPENSLFYSPQSTY